MAVTIQSQLNKIQLLDLDFKAPFDPAKIDGRKRRTLGGYRKKSGVYIIKEDEVIVYVGMSTSCIVEALYRHFYAWPDRKDNRRRKPGWYRITYADTLDDKDYEITVILTTPQQAPALERSMIVFLNPRDNRQKYQFALEELYNNRKITTDDGYKPMAELADEAPF